MTGGLRLFNKNTGGSEPERVCIAVEACPVPVPERPVQREEGPVNGGGNSDPLKVATHCLSKIRLYAGKPEYPALLCSVLSVPSSREDYGNERVTMRRVQAISRKLDAECFGIEDPQRLHAGRPRKGVKRQSDPHGDMGRSSERAARLPSGRSRKQQT